MLASVENVDTLKIDDARVLMKIPGTILNLTLTLWGPQYCIRGVGGCRNISNETAKTILAAPDIGVRDRGPFPGFAQSWEFKPTSI
jgi:hypothetical protein